LNFVPSASTVLGDLDVRVPDLVAQRDQRIVGIAFDRDTLPWPVMPLNAFTWPCTISVGASRTLTSVIRTAERESFGKLPPVSS